VRLNKSAMEKIDGSDLVIDAVEVGE
jgi:hypothetical protein